MNSIVMRACIPTDLDISPSGGIDLDESFALADLRGKTIEEATELFSTNSVYYQDHLVWIGPYAFAYYFSSFDNFIRSPRSERFADVFAGLLYVVKARMQRDPDSVIQIKEQVVDLIKYCLENYEKFCINLIADGDLVIQMNDILHIIMKWPAKTNSS